MKYLVYILLFCFSTLKAQNLITNPSFEDIDSCYGQPAGIGFDVFKWSGCKGWSNPIKSSSDLWCQNPIVGNTVPPNTISYQKPRTGENMAGIVIYDPIYISYREFIENKLIEPLKENTVYELIFHYSVAFGKNSGNCPANQFGLFASELELLDTSSFFLSNLQVIGSSNPESFVDDTINWSSCQIIFKANGGEKHLIIGNFQDSLNTSHISECDTSNWNGLTLAGDYYFLDDFYLSEYWNYKIPNVFSPNKDGVNDDFSPSIIGINDWELKILNRWGNEIISLNENNTTWSGGDYSNGIYFYLFKSNSKNIITQGFFQLIR